VWWTWEARLTATLILWLIYVAYFLVRSFAPEESRGARFAAVIGIIGFVDVPIIALATTLWRGLHPPPLIFEGGLAPSMALTLMVSIFAFTVLFFVLLILRVSMENNEIDIKQLKEQVG
jgi:heme exporter protein C